MKCDKCGAEDTQPEGAFNVWHHVNDHPKESGWYMVWNTNLGTRQYECIERAYFYSTGGLWGPTEKAITHWMHMPHPPRTMNVGSPTDG